MSSAASESGLPRCTAWRLRSRTLQFGRLPSLMGIVNVTPDSFSDGGKCFSPGLAVDQALRVEDAGADIIDVGGESTRPYSSPVSEEEELRRIEPVVASLVGRLAIPLSIDTSKARVARAAIEMGAEILNDVRAFEGDARMLALAAETQVAVCAMHMRGTPQNMQDDPSYHDVVQEVFDYLQQRDQALRSAGIDAERICLDPGIGFGKTHEHNWQLLSACARFHQLGRPILVGHSRKGFIGKLIGDKTAARDAGTVGVSLALARMEIQVLRVHDVKSTRDALVCFEAAGGFER
jgi:dihydropteroate synthase